MQTTTTETTTTTTTTTTGTERENDNSIIKYVNDENYRLNGMNAFLNNSNEYLSHFMLYQLLRHIPTDRLQDLNPLKDIFLKSDKHALEQLELYWTKSRQQLVTEERIIELMTVELSAMFLLTEPFEIINQLIHVYPFNSIKLDQRVSKFQRELQFYLSLLLSDNLSNKDSTDETMEMTNEEKGEWKELISIFLYNPDYFYDRYQKEYQHSDPSTDSHIKTNIMISLSHDLYYEIHHGKLTDLGQYSKIQSSGSDQYNKIISNGRLVCRHITIFENPLKATYIPLPPNGSISIPLSVNVPTNSTGNFSILVYLNCKRRGEVSAKLKGSDLRLFEIINCQVKFDPNTKNYVISSQNAVMEFSYALNNVSGNRQNEYLTVTIHEIKFSFQKHNFYSLFKARMNVKRRLALYLSRDVTRYIDSIKSNHGNHIYLNQRLNEPMKNVTFKDPVPAITERYFSGEYSVISLITLGESSTITNKSILRDHEDEEEEEEEVLIAVNPFFSHEYEESSEKIEMDSTVDRENKYTLQTRTKGTESYSRICWKISGDPICNHIYRTEDLVHWLENKNPNTSSICRTCHNSSVILTKYH